MAPWLFHRVSGVALIFLVIFKTYTGLAALGRLPDCGWDMKKTHAAVSVADKLLLFFLIFHVLYGIRLILIDLGVKWDRLLFWIATVLGVLLFCGSYWLIFTA